MSSRFTEPVSEFVELVCQVGVDGHPLGATNASGAMTCRHDNFIRRVLFVDGDGKPLTLTAAGGSGSNSAGLTFRPDLKTAGSSGAATDLRSLATASLPTNSVIILNETNAGLTGWALEVYDATADAGLRNVVSSDNDGGNGRRWIERL